MADLDDDATEGQIADHIAAGLSGDYGAWGMGVVEYMCPRCNKVYQIVTDELRSYDPLISNWHEKAKEGDYFSRFMFEYLAFSALLKNNLFIGAESDRNAIQELKRDAVREQAYVANIALHEPLSRLWQAVIDELAQSPLYNSSRDLDNPEIDSWWNSAGANPERNDGRPKGVIRSLVDWVNMVEFWHSVRNNLFHGGKNPTIRRDCFLVEHAYLTLASFVDAEIDRL